MNEELLKDEFEQALKRRNKDYADGYVEGLKDGYKQASPVESRVIASKHTEGSSANGAVVDINKIAKKYFNERTRIGFDEGELFHLYEYFRDGIEIGIKIATASL